MELQRLDKKHLNKRVLIYKPRYGAKPLVREAEIKEFSPCGKFCAVLFKSYDLTKSYSWILIEDYVVSSVLEDEKV